MWYHLRSIANTYFSKHSGAAPRAHMKTAVQGQIRASIQESRAASPLPLPLFLVVIVSVSFEHNMQQMAGIYYTILFVK